MKFVLYGKYLGDKLYHTDIIADFGGNDGFAANEFYLAHKIKPIVVECDPAKIEYAGKVYKLPTCESLIEKMPFADKYVDWGFCSHTAEHLRDTGAGLREIARVVKRGCAFIVPMEGKRSAMKNHSHYVSITKPARWINLFESNGWNVVDKRVASKYELHIIGEPK